MPHSFIPTHPSHEPDRRLRTTVYTPPDLDGPYAPPRSLINSELLYQKPNLTREVVPILLFGPTINTSTDTHLVQQRDVTDLTGRSAVDFLAVHDATATRLDPPLSLAWPRWPRSTLRLQPVSARPASRTQTSGGSQIGSCPARTYDVAVQRPSRSPHRLSTLATLANNPIALKMSLHNFTSTKHQKSDNDYQEERTITI